jgi:hypothetical protein
MHVASSSLEALEPGGHGLAAVVEDEAEVDGQVEVDAEDVALDGGAQAHGGLEVDEPLQQRAAGLRGRHAHLGLDQVQHVGAHAQLQRVARALAERGRRRRRRGWGGRGRRGAVATAGAGHGEHDQDDGEEQSDGGLSCHFAMRKLLDHTHKLKHKLLDYYC